MTLQRIQPILQPIQAIQPEEGVPYLYRVMLTPLGKGIGAITTGHVVTHLSLEDWCSMNGYRLTHVYPGARRAFPHERTDLF